jgi:hypothetical protein
MGPGAPAAARLGTASGGCCDPGKPLRFLTEPAMLPLFFRRLARCVPARVRCTDFVAVRVGVPAGVRVPLPAKGALPFRTPAKTCSLLLRVVALHGAAYCRYRAESIETLRCGGGRRRGAGDTLTRDLVPRTASL